MNHRMSVPSFGQTHSKLTTPLLTVRCTARYKHNILSDKTFIHHGSQNKSSKDLDSPCWTHEAVSWLALLPHFRHSCLVCPALSPDVQAQEESLSSRCQHTVYRKAMRYEIFSTKHYLKNYTNT